MCIRDRMNIGIPALSGLLHTKSGIAWQRDIEFRLDVDYDFHTIPPVSYTHLPIYAYGAEVALGAVVKIIVAGTLAVILGILPIIALLIIATGVLRVVVGGAHCTAYYRCLIYSLISFFGLGLLLKHYLPYLTSLSLSLIHI